MKWSQGFNFARLVFDALGFGANICVATTGNKW
jgi:hypothetical protein